VGGDAPDVMFPFDASETRGRNKESEKGISKPIATEHPFIVFLDITRSPFVLLHPASSPSINQVGSPYIPRLL